MPAIKNLLKWYATVKAAPAIADLQAPSSFYRYNEEQVNVGTPYNHRIYTVDPGQIYCLNMLIAMCRQGTPTLTQMRIDSGGDKYTWQVDPYGAAWSINLWEGNLFVDEGEHIEVFWTGAGANDDVFGFILGYLIDKY